MSRGGGVIATQVKFAVGTGGKLVMVTVNGNAADEPLAFVAVAVPE